MDLTALFSTIYESYCTISTNFYFYLQYFKRKIFNFNKKKPILNRPLVGLT